MRVLEVRGRKSGKLYSLPVDLLSEQGKLYLVAPRGYTQWVRNAEASGEITLRRGARVEGYRLRALSDAEKPPILKAYLDRFRREVQRYFPVPAGSPPERLGPIAPRYPVYERSDRAGRRVVLLAGGGVLFLADVVLATASNVWLVMVGVVLWGAHMSLTQGLLATTVTDTAPEALRGTAFGTFNLVSGVDGGRRARECL